MSELNMADQHRVSRSNLRQGVVYMIVGLVWGLAVPAATYPRLALGAHLQLTAHAVMFLVAGLLIAHLGLGTSRLSAGILIAGPWLTWPVMLTEMANGWWGTRVMLPLAAQQAGATGAVAWKEGVGDGSACAGRSGAAGLLGNHCFGSVRQGEG